MSDHAAARVVRLDEIESLPGPGTLRWIPVRHTLGIRAFGCNAYVAREAGTTVLSFGGPPTFTPSAWEWAFRASAVMRSERGRARSIIEDGFRTHPGDPSLLYQLACAEALDGHAPAALDALRRAIMGRPEIADWARDDADFASLGDDPAFGTLVAP